MTRACMCGAELSCSIELHAVASKIPEPPMGISQIMNRVYDGRKPETASSTAKITAATISTLIRGRLRRRADVRAPATEPSACAVDSKP